MAFDLRMFVFARSWLGDLPGTTSRHAQNWVSTPIDALTRCRTSSRQLCQFRQRRLVPIESPICRKNFRTIAMAMLASGLKSPKNRTNTISRSPFLQRQKWRGGTHLHTRWPKQATHTGNYQVAPRFFLRRNVDVTSETLLAFTSFKVRFRLKTASTRWSLHTEISFCKKEKHQNRSFSVSFPNRLSMNELWTTPKMVN